MPSDPALGRLAVARGFISCAQLEAVLQRRGAADPDAPLDALLVGAGLLTWEQVRELLASGAPEGRGLDAAGAAAAPVPAAAGAPAQPPPASPTTRTVSHPDAPPPAPGAPLHAPVDTLPPVTSGPSDPAAPPLLPAPDPLWPPAPPNPAASSPGPAPAVAGRLRFGKYEIVAELGRGGMGVVYKAWHPGLRTHFAVKVLLVGAAASPEVVARFHREALATARLTHPGIVAIHDFGVEDGKPYLAMDLVEGTPLSQALSDPARAGLAAPAGGGHPEGPTRGLAARDAARIALEVADAIEHAHRHGVIHRDLKPANVLLDRDGHARILDFGLAKLLDRGDVTSGRELSRSGMVMGTLAYMAPEQAGGEVRAIDERTDVYALGALLYEMTTGRPPHSGASELELLARVLTTEPVRPRRLVPSLPRDLETVLLKAMEHEPARRYERAAALAGELRRFLDGRPVAARPPSTARRLVAAARRRPALAATCAALLVAGGAAAFWSWRAATTEGQRAVLRARVLTDLRAKAGLFVDAALDLRRAGVPPRAQEAENLARLKRAVTEAVRADPSAPEPHYHLGRMERALLRFPEARQAQEEALAQDPGYAPSRYECGLLGAVEVRRLRDAKRMELMRLRASGAGRERAAPVVPGNAEVERAYPEVAELKRRALADLAQVAAAADAQPGMTARARAARGMAAALAGDADAERLLAQALADDGRLEEVHAAFAECACARGDWEEAARRYEAGWKYDLGYIPHVFGLGESLRLAAEMAESRGRDGGDLRRHGIAALAEALGRDPAQADLWALQATLRYGEGAARWTRGGDPSADFREALAGYARALAMNPNSVVATSHRANVYQALGDARRARGEDPTADYEAALADYDRTLGLDPTSAPAANNQASTYQALGDAKLARGQDPTGEYRKALAGYDRALAIEPNNALAASNQAIVYKSLGDARRRLGAEPVEEYRNALAGFDRALALDPSFFPAVVNRATLHKMMGDARHMRGQDPAAEYGQALAGFDRAREMNPNSVEAAVGQASLNLALGNARRARGQDPTEEYRKAQAGYDRAAALNPGLAEAANGRGLVDQACGDLKRARGEDPTDEYRQALADHERALAINPSFADAAANRAMALALLAELKRLRGEDPSAEYRRAVAGFEQAVRLNPGFWQGHANRGRLLERLGAPAQAVAAYEAALAIAGDAVPELKQAHARARAAADAAGTGPTAAAPPWRALADRAAEAIDKGDYAAACPLYEQALAAAPADAAADLTSRATLTAAEYNLACIFALASAGRDGPSAPARPVDSAQAARLRDRAFEQLTRSIALGGRDRKQFEADADLVPLHDDPRWADLLGRLAGDPPK